MSRDLRRLDAFVKTRQDIRSKSAVGGVITLVAGITAALLFFSHIFVYTIGNRTQHSLHLSKSTSIPLLPNHATQKASDRSGKINLSMRVTFPHLSCGQIDVIHDSASLSTGELKKIHGSHSLTLRKATSTELNKMKGGEKFKSGDGCTVDGHLLVPIVSGDLAIGISKRTWEEALRVLSISQSMGERDNLKKSLSVFNVSHYVHHVRFGVPFPYAADEPLENRAHVIENIFGGIALEQVNVKLIPTMHQTFLSSRMTYQMSVVDLTVQPQTLVAQGVPSLPGLSIAYDFTPLTVHQTSARENFLVFLSSLLSIVGGVFVTVGLLTGCLLHSAQAVAKKID